jgi:hypothetical protein
MIVPIVPKILIAPADSIHEKEYHDPFVGTWSCKDLVMKAKTGWQKLLVAGLLISATTTGCLQTTIGGQTLPSAYYLDDDVQYFPTGPEQKLAKQIAALERYKAEQIAVQQGLNENLNP